MGIVYRDLKPENILCVEQNSIKRIKITGFGLSKIMVKNQKLNRLTNRRITLSYTAPEILRGKGHDNTVDLWSIGVIMYILLCGYPPFYGENEHDVKSHLSGN